MSDHEFAQDAERAGGGWPLRYADLLPHYERVEKSLKMRGEVAGLDQLPDGHYSSPPGPLTYAERCFAEGLRQHWPDRPCVRIRSTNPELKHAGTPWPISSSLGSTIHEAKKTGLLRLLPDAVVWRVAETPGRPQLRRVEFVHRETREPGHVDGRAVVLGASTIESVRLLLNSTSERHPRGLGNSSGSLGRGLMDHWFRVVAARLPPAWTTPAAEAPLFWNGDGLYIPRFRNLGGQKEAFSGGYGIWVSMGRSGVAGVGETPAHELAQFIAFGETMLNDDNRVLLDPVTRDAWGIPSARVEFSYSENEQLAAQDAVAEICTMAKRFGLEILQVGSLLDPGLSIHEVGSARMGADRALSVTDPSNRLWDDPQVLVVDGACWPTAGYQNPTLTMMALTVRATERLAQQLSRGD
jgi:choline dehydrogenase-like flavoprotein